MPTCHSLIYVVVDVFVATLKLNDFSSRVLSPVAAESYTLAVLSC